MVTQGQVRHPQLQCARYSQVPVTQE